MIEIICDHDIYTYNNYHITKAFFPSEEVCQRVEPEAGAVVCVHLPDHTFISLKQSELAGIDDMKQRKHYVDQWLYHAYEKYTGQSLAWGLLTGVRPTKLAMQKISDGMDEVEFIKWMTEEFRVSKKKAWLALDIARREKQILERLDYKDGYSLYVGIPFCPSICSYCSFSSGSIEEWKNYVDVYLDALCKELSYIGGCSRNKKLNTIYIGGGTPTTLSGYQLERLLTQIDRTFSRENLLEYTVEAGRPDSITEEKLQVLKGHGITRISINPQTMQQKTLDLIGRKHTVEQIRTVFWMARELGFDNINMDLIAGLPKESVSDMSDTLRQVKELAPDSLTVHSLAVKRAAKMGQEKTVTGSISNMEDSMDTMGRNISKMIELAADAAGEMKMVPYYLYRQKNIAGNFENVGYAKVDKAGIYNILIMEEKQSIVAAGAGSATKIVLNKPVAVRGSKNKRETTLMRIENVKDIKQYIIRIDEMIERKGEWLWR